MADANITISINAENNAKAGFDAASDSLKSLEKALKNAQQEAAKFYEPFEEYWLSQAETPEEVEKVLKEVAGLREEYAQIITRNLEKQMEEQKKIVEKGEKEVTKTIKTEQGEQERSYRKTMLALRDITGAYNSVERYINDVTKAFDDQKLSVKEVGDLMGKLPGTIAEVVEGYKAIKSLPGLLGVSGGLLAGSAAAVAAIAGVTAGIIMQAKAAEKARNANQWNQFALAASAETYEEYLALAGQHTASMSDQISVGMGWQTTMWSTVEVTDKLTDSQYDGIKAQAEYLKAFNDSTYDASFLEDAWEAHDEWVDGADDRAKAIRSAYEMELSLLDTVISGAFGQMQEDYTAGQYDLLTLIQEKEAEIAKAISYGYSEQGTKLQGLYGDLDELNTKYDENATEHEEATNRILYGIMRQRLEMSGLSNEMKLDLSESIAKAYGLWDDETLQAQQNWDIFMNAVLTGSEISIETIEALGLSVDSLPKDVPLNIKVNVDRSMLDALLANLGAAMGISVPMGGNGIPAGAPSGGESGSWTLGGKTYTYRWKDSEGDWNYRAGGGSVYGNNPYIVGEQGPELFVPQGSGTIIPNNKLGGGGNVYVTINTPVNLADEVFVERKLYPYIKKGMQQAMRGA